MRRQQFMGTEEMDRQPITREGYDKLRAEIQHLDDVVMPEIAERIASARAEGDLKENAEYHGQREEQGRVQAKIYALKTKLASCYIVDKADMPKGQVTFGSTVTIKDLDLDEEETYEFVGPGEENYDGPVMKILTTSPIAVGLMGKKAGEKVEISLPRGTMNVEIVRIVDHGD
jgi:transcription elongation factor GreA